VEDLVSGALGGLAAAGGAALAQAAATDAWERAKAGAMRIMTRRNPDAAAAVDRRLEQTRTTVLEASNGEQQRAISSSAQAWATRFQDALDDDPDTEPLLQELLNTLRGTVADSVRASAANGMAVGRDAHLAAADSSIVASVITAGSVSTGNPPPPGPA
jgi:hypothetical protein